MLVSYEELRKHFGGATAAEVAARAEGEGVKCLSGIKGKPFTTLDAINHALGIPTKQQASIATHQQREIKVP